MNAAEAYRLIVSAPFSKVWIAKLTKQPHIMSATRRQVPESEFISAVLQYTMGRLKEGSDTMSITIDDKVVAEITIKDRSLLE